MVNIIEDSKVLIESIESKVISIYKKENLIPLRGENSSYKINGKKILIWHGDVVRKCCIANNEIFKAKKYSPRKNLDDLFFSSDEIIYFTAHLYFYRDFINNPLKDSINSSGRKLYPMLENLAGKRYDMYLGVVYEKLYNYWDRIGDMIASFFPMKFKGDVYFSRTINTLYKDYKDNPDMQWLKNFADTEYSNFNKERINIVHDISKNINQKWDVLKNVDSDQEAIDFQIKRESYPDYFKDMNEDCKIGFQKAMNFLEVIDKTVYKDVVYTPPIDIK